MTDNILDLLGQRGFFPNETYDGWFDLRIGGPHALSVPRYIVAVELAEMTITVHLLTGNRVGISDVRLSPNVPLSIVATVIDLTIAQAATG